jgi:hypothetical protein
MGMGIFIGCGYGSHTRIDVATLYPVYLLMHYIHLQYLSPAHFIKECFPWARQSKDMRLSTPRPP